MKVALFSAARITVLAQQSAPRLAELAMPALCRFVLLASLCLILTTQAQAQQPATATLTGTVVDAETGQPLEGAHVFIAVSMMGTVTNRLGEYRLEGVPLGAHRLYVSVIGFDPEARDVLLREAKEYRFDYKLNTAVLEAPGVTVEAKGDKNWKKRLEKFTRLFIGETPNAEQVVITNPEVLDFEEKVGHFSARASEPLLIENRALGYRVQYFLKEFVAETSRTKYDGEPLYEPLDAESPAQADEWAQKRREAFLGSFRHFILAVLANRTEEQGFKVYSRPAASGGSFQNSALGGAQMAGNERFPLDPQEIIQPGEVAGERILDFHGFVEITFTGELEDEAFLAWQGEHRKPRFRTSLIQLEHGPTVVDAKGDMLDPYGITFYGYLAFERVADELPKEYRPH